MSSTTRTTVKSGKNSKGDSGKSHKHDKSDTGKGSNDKQHGGGENSRSKNDDPGIKEKVRQLIEMTRRSEEEVCLALYECDYNVEHAINMLFENMVEGEWETSSKKKKNRQASTSKVESEEAAPVDEWNENPEQTNEKEKPRNKSGGGPPRLHGRHNDSRGCKLIMNLQNICKKLTKCRGRYSLFKTNSNGEWETSSKKKKNRQASTSKVESEEAAPVDEWNENPEQTNEKEKPRNKSGGGPPRLHGRHNDSRGWRGRENKENERNLDDGSQQERKERRGRGAHVRGGTGRGRGGGRPGSRYPPRNNRNNFSNARPIETWDNSIPWESTTITNSSHTNYPSEENWDEFPPADDWSTEEYTGSLADTKVFTPSMVMQSEIDSSVDQTKSNVMPTMTIESMLPPIVGTLSAAQTQYLNQLTQQSNENMKSAQYATGQASQPYDNTTSQPYNTGQTYGNNSVSTAQYNSNAQYGSSPTTNTYNNTNYVVANSNFVATADTQMQPQHHPVRTKTQRARVPPPSKIPSSAVEMPGDINSSIGYLDVQFGAMDFMSDSSSFDGVSDNKFSPTNDTNLTNTIQTSNTNIDLSQAVPNPPLDVYSSKTNTQQNSITTALSQNLTNTDAIPQSNEHLSGTYGSLPRSSTVAANATQTITPTGLDLNKQNEKHSYSQSSTYNSYQPKTTTYQNQNYSSSNYSAPQTTSNSYANSNTPSYNTQSTGNTYQNSYSSVSSYQTNPNTSTFPISQANSYPTNNQYQQTSQSVVYGANTGLNSSSSYGNPPSNSQYTGYNASSNKMVKESNYDGTTTSVNSTTTATSSINTSTLPQTTATGTKSTTALAKNTSNNVMSNIPPTGVAPVMGTQYIMGQVPYYQQPIYSFEDMQLLQQRIPHVAGYYDMGYPTPTTLAAVRDGTLANVAYSISDGRFTRGDNNTSPVPSTLSQQTSTLTQGHQAQPLLAQTGAGPFFYTSYSPMQPTYQFPAMYPQLSAVTNAHGSNNTQYPKPATYGSGYGSGYDPLTQTQDYSKGGYVSNTQGQSKASGANASTGVSTGNDLTAMYGKSHAALGKVNSYDKQGFHSGTPPPFTGALHGNQNTGLAPSGTNYNPMFISPLPPQHSTPLMHQQIHQDSNSSGQRSQASSQAKSGAKQSYPASYWNQA
ncbi:hypothetical protein FQA39_LY04957 [Lamprigera yunnana]|nr:hypothetical protein FQA39_LY04957 [Lamprigera yunnana]